MPARSAYTPAKAKKDPLCQLYHNRQVLAIKRVNLTAHTEAEIVSSALLHLVEKNQQVQPLQDGFKCQNQGGNGASGK